MGDVKEPIFMQVDEVLQLSETKSRPTIGEVMVKDWDIRVCVAI